MGYKIKRRMTYAEMVNYVGILAEQVKTFNPDEIVGVARSGMPYATWVAQILKIKHLGYLNLANKELVLSNKNAKRIMVIDDNTLSGDSYYEVKTLMDYKRKPLPLPLLKPKFEWRFGVLFTDSLATPQEVKDEVFSGIDLDYFATSVPGMMKNFKYKVRSRDEGI